MLASDSVAAVPAPDGGRESASAHSRCTLDATSVASAASQPEQMSGHRRQAWNVVKIVRQEVPSSSVPQGRGRSLARWAAQGWSAGVPRWLGLQGQRSFGVRIGLAGGLQEGVDRHPAGAPCAHFERSPFLPSDACADLRHGAGNRISGSGRGRERLDSGPSRGHAVATESPSRRAWKRAGDSLRWMERAMGMPRGNRMRGMVLAAATAVFCWAGIGGADAMPRGWPGYNSCGAEHEEELKKEHESFDPDQRRQWVMETRQWIAQETARIERESGYQLSEDDRKHYFGYLYRNIEYLQQPIDEEEAVDASAEYHTCLAWRGEQEGVIVLYRLSDEYSSVIATFHLAEFYEKSGYENLRESGDWSNLDKAIETFNLQKAIIKVWNRYGEPDTRHEWDENIYQYELNGYYRALRAYAWAARYALWGSHDWHAKRSPGYDSADGWDHSLGYDPNNRDLYLESLKHSADDCISLPNKRHFITQYFDFVKGACQTLQETAIKLLPLQNQRLEILLEDECRNDVLKCDEYMDIYARMYDIMKTAMDTVTESKFW